MHIPFRSLFILTHRHTLIEMALWLFIISPRNSSEHPPLFAENLGTQAMFADFNIIF
jgi:hypothetical protein